MKYNKWKEANDYWRMVINKPFKIKGRNVLLLNYLATYSNRQNKSSYVTKTMYRFIDYLDAISKEINSYITELNSDRNSLLFYKNRYREDLIGINPYISITYTQLEAINNFKNAYAPYNRTYYNRYKLRKSVVNNLLDAIDEISPIQDVLRQHRYNRTHKRKHPYPVVNDNPFDNHYSRTQYYDNYKQFYLDCLKRKIDITKTFYKYHSSLDIHNIFNKRNT